MAVIPGPKSDLQERLRARMLGHKDPQTRIPARPTIYRGIQMRSRLEARYAGSLDAFGLDWEYEPVCFANGASQWLPDFRIGRVDDKCYVEVKPYVAPWLNSNGLQRWAETLWASVPCGVVVLWTPDESVVAVPWSINPISREGAGRPVPIHHWAKDPASVSRSWPW